MPEPFTLTALTAATALGYSQAMEQARAEEVQRIERERRKLPAGALIQSFRLSEPGKITIDLSTRIATYFIAVQTAQTGAAGLYYVRLGSDIQLDGADPQRPSGNRSGGDWDWVGSLGSKSVVLRADSDIDIITIYATAPTDGVIVAGAHKQDLPN